MIYGLQRGIIMAFARIGRNRQDNVKSCQN
jgi:hypothetical protein